VQRVRHAVQPAAPKRRQASPQAPRIGGQDEGLGGLMARINMHRLTTASMPRITPNRSALASSTR